MVPSDLAARMVAAASEHWQSFLVSDGTALINRTGQRARIMKPPPHSPAFTQVAMGDYHVALLTSDGMVFCYRFQEVRPGEDDIMFDEKNIPSVPLLHADSRRGELYADVAKRRKSS